MYRSVPAQTLPNAGAGRPTHGVVGSLRRGEEARDLAVVWTNPVGVLLDLERTTDKLADEVHDLADTDIDPRTELYGAADRLGSRESCEVPFSSVFDVREVASRRQGAESNRAPSERLRHNRRDDGAG